MRLVVVGADRVVDMAVPRGRERGLAWPLGRARSGLLEVQVGESPPPPGVLVEVERWPSGSAMARRALVRGSLLQPGRVVEVERGPSAKGWRPGDGSRGV